MSNNNIENQQIAPEMTNEPVNTQRICVSYRQHSALTVDALAQQLNLITDERRAEVKFSGKVRDTLKVRSLLLSLYDIVGSDYRYKPKDRTAYHAFRQHRQANPNEGAWASQQAYFAWLLQNDPLAFCMLDPVISVHPDQISLEVFSKDEASYACLALEMSAFDKINESIYGTTNINFSENLAKTLETARSYRDFELVIDEGKVATQISEANKQVAKHMEMQIQLPDSWTRGFLQVQSAAMIEKQRFHLAPIDLYNLLRQLRLNADQKKKRRGIRVELEPNKAPRLVLEPWEIVLESSLDGQKGLFSGKEGQVLRIWGRRRLMMLKRILPLIDDIEVQILGSAMPSFWILRGKDFSFTFALTGFTNKDWSQGACFDLLLPRAYEAKSLDADLQKVMATLQAKWVLSQAQLTKETGLKSTPLLKALQHGCQLGQLIYDLNKQVYRLRPLLDAQSNYDFKRLVYRNEQDRHAHDLIAKPKAVQLEKEHFIPTRGLELVAKIKDIGANFSERTSLLLDAEGYVKKAECSCSFFRQHQLRNGPCSHLIATRIAQAQLEALYKNNPKKRQTIMVETQLFSRRQGEEEQLVQVTLERKRVIIRRGIAGQELQPQRLQFNHVDKARAAYFDELSKLVAFGYLNVVG